MQAEGKDGVFARHEACAAASRAGLAALGFELFADPRRRVEDRDRRAAARGPRLEGVQRRDQGATASSSPAARASSTGKIFRLGHLGSVTVDEILGTIAVLERVTLEQGRRSSRVARSRRPRRRRSRSRPGVGGPRPATHAPPARVRVLVAEPIAARGHRPPPRRTRGRRAAGLSPRRALRDPRRLRRARRPEPGPGRRRRHRGGRQPAPSSGGPAWASTTSTSTPRPRAGITVVNAPTGNTIAAAEHTLALLYGVARTDRRRRCVRPARRVEAAPVHRPRAARPDAGDRRARQDRPGDRRPGPGDGDGVLGVGSVRDGRAGRPPRRRARRVRRRCSSESDVVTVHVPLTRATRGLIGRDQLARMKPGAILLNVARGGILDEAAVAEALRDGRLGGAGDRRLRARAADRLAAARRAEHAPDPAPRRVHGRGPGPRRRGGRRPGPRRPRRPVGALRGQRPAADARDRPGHRAVPAAGRDARPVLRPVRAGRGPDAHPRDRRRARRVRRVAADRRGPARADRDVDDRSGSTSSTPPPLAKARGITVVERKTPDAGAYAAQLSLSGESGGRTTTVAGTVAGGEPRLTRLDDYRLDIEPTDVMLITHHRDRPGMIGRIGQTLGEADVNISAMHVGRTRRAPTP